MSSRHAYLSEDAIAQEVSGETVILDLKSEQYFSLDLVGTRIWQLLAETSEIDAIYQQLQQEYDVEPTQLQDDLNHLISHLAEEGLISIE